jgi:A/G-specific adenine glycosylase
MSSRRDFSGSTITSSSISIESILDKFKEDKLEKTIDQSTIVVIRQQLLIWYRVNGRKLPWRGNFQFEDNFQYDFPNPYGTWVSEIMLQQTQVATVIPYWIKWMKVYPTVVALSQATPDEVNKLWAGLGYYRRAQMLLKGSQTVVNKYDGMLPQTVTELKEIEGIGPYTAGAIASIAFNQVSPIVDGNIIRIVSRLLALKCVVGSREMDKLCWQIASDLVDPDNPGDFNQALMDLGATVCRPVFPVCDKCPISSFCLAKKIVDNSSCSGEMLRRREQTNHQEQLK